jgi:hypothetical protein
MALIWKVRAARFAVFGRGSFIPKTDIPLNDTLHHYTEWYCSIWVVKRVQSIKPLKCYSNLKTCTIDVWFWFQPITSMIKRSLKVFNEKCRLYLWNIIWEINDRENCVKIMEDSHWNTKQQAWDRTSLRIQYNSEIMPPTQPILDTTQQLECLSKMQSAGQGSPSFLQGLYLTILLSDTISVHKSMPTKYLCFDRISDSR